MSPIDIAPMSSTCARRSPRLPRAAGLALAGAAALAASACQVPSGDVTGDLVTRADFSIAGDDIPVSLCPAEDESRLSAAEGALVGPHFALQVECVASFKEVPEGFDLAYLFGDDTELVPPGEGREFTLVQFAPEPAVEAPGEDLSQVSGTLRIGDASWDFDKEAPKPGAVYLAVAEEGAPVSLEFTDADRAQTLDLRERAREGQLEALYTGQFEAKTDIIEHSVDAKLTTGSYEYWVEDWTYSTDFVGNRAVYKEGTGWVAEADRAMLTVSFAWLRSGSGLEWDIDPEKALTVSGPDGKLEASNVVHRDEEWDDGEMRYYSLDYSVPADALEFDLEYHPDGSVHWPDEGIDMPVSGDKTHEAKLDFK